MHTCKSVHPVFLFLLLSCFFPRLGHAQNQLIKADAVAFQHPDLDQSFTKYQVFTLDATPIYELAQAGNRFQFNLQLGNRPAWPLQLDPHDLRAPTYREVALTERGADLLPTRPNITFRGTVGAAREATRFTITPTYILGMVQFQGTTFFLEPLQKLISTAPADYYLLYDAADVVSDPTLECTFTAGKKNFGIPQEDDHPHKVEGSTKMMACMAVELATAGDFLMFQRYGSDMAVNDFILTVTNLMEPLYDDFSLDFVIVDQFVPTSAAANPWTTSDESFDILDDFSAWAPGNFATHDVGQIWTARNIQGCGSGPGNFGLIGCAQTIGGVCGGERYNVCEDFSNSSNCLRALSAHEIGHLFDGVHSQSDGSSIMTPTIQCGSTYWTANNITRIQNHIDSRDCLSACANCNIVVTADVMDETCPGASDGNITAGVSGNQGLVAYTLSGPVNQSNTTGVFGPLPPGNYTLQALDNGGGLNCFDQIAVAVVPGPDNTPPTNTCPDFVANFEVCPNAIGPNTPNNVWFAVGADLSFTSAAGGIYTTVVNLAGCVSDNYTSLANIEITLDASYAEGICPKTIVNEFKMRDECGNVSTDRIVVRHVLAESVAPVWDFGCQIDAVFTTENGNVCPADATISLNEGDEIDVNTGWTVGGIPILPLAGCVSDACTAANNLVIRVDDITITGDACSRTIAVTFLAIDQCGNISLPFSCNYTFVDNTAPVVNYLGLPSGTTITRECNIADPNWMPFVPTEELTIFDNCAAFEDLTIVLEDILVEEGICGVSNFLSIWRCTWTVTDPCGNETVYVLFTRIVDTTGPVYDFFPPDVTIECSDAVPFAEPTAKDACSEVAIRFTDLIIPGSCTYDYTIQRTWVAEDGCGNMTPQIQKIDVSDHTPPVITFIDQYVYNYTSGQSVFVDCGEFGRITGLGTWAVSANDNCSGDLPTSFAYEDDGYFDCQAYGYIGHVKTSWTSTDECGNTSVATIHWYLVDQTPPTLSGIPADDCVSSLPPVPTVQAVDDCDFAVVEFSQSEPIDCDAGQFVIRTWTATDACGNSTSASQRIVFNDGNGPTVNVNFPGLDGLPSGSTAQLTAVCDANGEALVPDLVAAVELLDGCSTQNARTMLELLDSGDCTTTGYLARYQLTVIATDACDNTTTYQLFVELLDRTGPAINGPTDVVAACGEAIAEVTAADGCGQVASLTFVDANPIVSCAAAPQSYDRVWTATDACGNATEFIQHITVLDTEGPILRNVPADACNDETLPDEVTAFDTCSGMMADVQFSEERTTETDCGQVLTRTWTATDACGNTSTATQQVFFTDATPPVLHFAHPLLVGLADGDELILPVGFDFGNPQEPYDFGAGAVAISDNCAANLTATLNVVDLEERPCRVSGYLSRQRLTWTATDPCGNRSQISIILLYEDTYGPEIFRVPANVVIYCEDPIPARAEVFVKDNYDDDVVAVFTEQYVSEPFGLRLIRRWTATDGCGNTTVAEQFIDIYDNTLECSFDFPETIFCHSEDNLIKVNASGGWAPYSYRWEMTDCDGFITSDPTNASILYTIGYTTQNFSVTITDAVGCQRVCTTTIMCEKPIPGDNLGLLSLGNSAIDFTVYPNPVDQQLVVQAPTLVEQTVVVRVYSLYGQEMFRQNFAAWPQTGLEIDTQHLPAGTYLVQLVGQDTVPLSKQIVVLH